MEKDSHKEVGINIGSEASFLLISTIVGGKVFEIKSDGSVWYTVKGEYRVADNDKKLGIALGEAFKTLAKINEETIKKQNAVHIN